MSQKEINRQKLEEIAEYTGDIELMAMFWSMFDSLSVKKQEQYLIWAEEIKNNYGKGVQR